MKRFRPVLAIAVAFAAFAAAGHRLSAEDPGVRITYLYDNTIAAPGTQADWGFACLVEGRGHTILFDTGTKPEVLRHNMTALKVDPARIEAVVLSHEHPDHTAGIAALPDGSRLPVYAGEHFRLPPASDAALARMDARRVAVTSAGPVQMFPGFTVSEEIVRNNAYEDALVIDTPAGSVVIVGCAHPGIVPMLQRVAATTKRPIHMVIGGFHLLQAAPDDVRKIVAEFKTLGVGWAGPTHCTGDGAMRLFREAYGDHFIAGGVGTVVTVPKPK